MSVLSFPILNGYFEFEPYFMQENWIGFMWIFALKFVVHGNYIRIFFMRSLIVWCVKGHFFKVKNIQYSWTLSDWIRTAHLLGTIPVMWLSGPFFSSLYFRYYANHKPEMALAITSFEALCGFITLKVLLLSLDYYFKLNNSKSSSSTFSC